MADASETVGSLREAVGRFVEQRDWMQFHDPKNLSMSIAIEAAELMEHFQWIGGDEARRLRDRPEDLQQVREELADILCYALAFANSTGIDLSEAVREKLVKNAVKYPAERFRGKYK